MPSNTLSYLYARSALSTMAFSGSLSTTSASLNGAGGQGANGFPLPRRGAITSLALWDGTTMRTDTDEIPFNAGDRISVFCQNMGSDFTVKVRVNGVSTELLVTGVPYNSALTATVELYLMRD
jgi:hypothetical protein